MKQLRWLSLLLLLPMVLGALPATTGAQQPDTPTKATLAQPLSLGNAPQRAHQPAVDAAPKAAPEQGAWQLGPDSPLTELTRLDAVFVPGPEPWGNKVYIMGGRSGSSTESPDIIAFDPLVGTYADTGFDMVEDVSNYTANLVNDDGTGRGPAIYVIGGYSADSVPAVNIGTVQRFYPQVGVVEALPPADDWTVTVAGELVAAMGYAVVDDIIYVFGGWENLVDPYFYAGTWAFDPTQPSGSRWTDLGINLNPARSYIQVAVQDGKIYAMGGIYQYVGGDLVPTTIAEVLDTANLAAGWTSIAPMPVASAEGRGFGFDADTKAPAPWGDHIYVVGGGDWNGRSAEVMEYIPSTNTWNQAFPDLNQERRDHAGAFIPLCTADPNDGLPGMWVFGGNIGADNPPFGDPEYYALGCAAECSVLVVDDDWDFDQTVPNDGGRPYYTSALDYLGYSYDVWDTVTQGQPATGDMANYDVVIWFTGYAWEDGVFSPTNEADVGAYLDAGGNFILSSQEYHYEAGTITPFMVNYLGVADITDDMIELDPVGNAGNPIGDGLGPYAMVRPDDWAAYWPTGSYEGPYDDYAIAGPGADEPFRFNASGQNNSTSYDSGAFKTSFLAWPLEWIDTVEERAEILGAALDWMCVPSGIPIITLVPPYQESFADPGDEVAYTLTLNNMLGYEETFTVTYDSVWPIVGPATVGPIPDGGAADFVVTVTVPIDANCLDEDMATLTAWDPTMAYSDTSELRTVAGPAWQIEDNTGASGAHWMAFACTDDYGTAGTCFYAGGLGAGNNVTGAAQMYDIATATWTALPPLPIPVFGAVGGFVAGRFCVAGGYTTTTGDWDGTYALQCFDPATATWATGPDIPGPVEIGGAGGAAGGVVDGNLHVTGGCGANTCASNQHFYYDGTTWTPAAILPDFLVFHGAAAGQGRLYVGGDYAGGTDFYEYDPGLDVWVARASLPANAGQKSPVGAVVPGGVFWWGGDLGDWANVQDTTWYWNPVVNAWVQFTALLNQATTGAGGGFADGRLWNFGGSTGSGPITPPPHESLLYCLPPTPGAGSLSGHVYDANTGAPIADANVYLEGLTDPNFWEERRTAADGGYSFDPLLANTYWLHAMGMDYFNQYYIGPITITEGVPTVVDVYLAASWPELSDTAVSVDVPASLTLIYPVTLTNSGTGDLHYHVSEVPTDGIFPVPESTMPRGVDAQVYRDLDSSTDGTARFIVYLAEQADLSPAFAMDWAARGHFVLDTLRSTAQRTQAGLLADLAAAGVTYESRYIVNAVVVTGGRALVDKIIARPEVAYIGPDTAYAAPAPVESSPAPDSAEAVEWGIHRVKADAVWTDFGVTGAGVVVSNIDTGVQYDHPALVNQYRGNLGGGSYDHNYNWWDPYGDNPSAPFDYGGHGSHTMGTMCGSDDPSNPISATNAIGMAPGAQWVACNGFDQGGSGYDAELLECAEFLLAPWDLNGANPDPAMRPHVVNNSWGGGPAQWWYMQSIYAWRAAGIFPSFSGGNDGPGCGTVHSPSDTYNVLSTGATDINDEIAGFSSRGPADITGLMKPNVSAPGVNIRSSVPGSSYASFGGTSMASPHTAGEAALIWSAVPELRGNVQQTYWLIEQSAMPITTNQGCGGDGPNDVPNNVYGWGRIDAYEAVNMALSAGWDIPWLAVDPAQGVIAPDGWGIIDLALDATGLTPGECYTGTLKFEYNDPYVHEQFVPVEMCVTEACDPVDIVVVTPTIAGCSVSFEAVLTGEAPFTYLWSFGDGETSALAAPTHVYATGTYTGTLEVWNCSQAGYDIEQFTVTVECPEFEYVYLPLIYRSAP